MSSEMLCPASDCECRRHEMDCRMTCPASDCESGRVRELCGCGGGDDGHGGYCRDCGGSGERWRDCELCAGAGVLFVDEELVKALIERLES